MKLSERDTPTDLRLQAEQHGITTSWTDSEERTHHVEAPTLRALLDILRTDVLATEDGATAPRVVVAPAGQTVSIALPGSFTDLHLEIDPRSPATTAHTGDRSGVRAARSTASPSGNRSGETVVSLDPTVPVGRHCLIAGGQGVPTTNITVLVTPPTAHRGPDQRALSLFVPAYALHTEPGGPVGTLAELNRFAAGLAKHGVSALATLPLNATFCGRGREPFDPSPYSPVSRRHWNELFADLGHLPGPGGQPAMLAPEREPDFRARTDLSSVDWRAVAASVSSVLDRAISVDRFRSEIITWANERPDVVSYSRFRASLERTGMPPALPCDDTAESIDQADRFALRHALGQRLMADQLKSLANEWTERDQVLALDLPVGSHPAGWENWSSPDEFARGASVGAPPDSFFRSGQNWGFAPLHPERSRDGGHRMWHDTIAAACDHTGLLRVDHVMAIHRLWWIPAGAEPSQGAYVRYPAEELWADLVITSHLTSTIIVGEDLGTVPPEVIDARRRYGVLGMYEEQFVADRPDAQSLPPVPDDVIAGVRTHDMVPFHAFLTGADRGLRSELGLEQTDTPQERDQSIEIWRQLIEEELGRPVGGDPNALLEAALERLARSDAPLVSIDLDDLLGVDMPHNVPGVADYPGLWSKRSPLTVDSLLKSPAIGPVLDRIALLRQESNQ